MGRERERKREERGERKLFLLALAGIFSVIFYLGGVAGPSRRPNNDLKLNPGELGKKIKTDFKILIHKTFNTSLRELLLLYYVQL